MYSSIVKCKKDSYSFRCKILSVLISDKLIYVQQLYINRSKNLCSIKKYIDLFQFHNMKLNNILYYLAI